MSLSSRVSELAVTVGQQMKALRAELQDQFVPVSGTVVLPASLPVGGLIGYRATSSTTFQAPTLSATLDPGAYVFEKISATEWRYRVIAEGRPLDFVDIIEDDMSVARTNIYGTTTPVGNRPYSVALGAAIGGGNVGLGAMKVEGGVAMRNGTIGAGAWVPTDWVDMRVLVGYNVSGGTSAQARALARNDPDYMPVPYETRRMPLQAIMKGNGDLTFEPWLDGTTWRQKPMGTGLPLTGVLELEVVGQQLRILVNGTQVGATQVLTLAHTLEGQVAGFGVYETGTVSSFRVLAIQ